MRHVEEIRYEINRLEKAIFQLEGAPTYSEETKRTLKTQWNGRKWALKWVLEEEK